MVGKTQTCGSCGRGPEDAEEVEVTDVTGPKGNHVHRVYEYVCECGCEYVDGVQVGEVPHPVSGPHA